MFLNKGKMSVSDGDWAIPHSQSGFILVLGMYLQPAVTEENILVALWGEGNDFCRSQRVFSTEGIPQP